MRVDMLRASVQICNKIDFIPQIHHEPIIESTPVAVQPRNLTCDTCQNLKLLEVPVEYLKAYTPHPGMV